ncbi:hypothetical protein HFP71_37220 [Streptomyces sp. ARC32]|uniref:hypothetical protein n=1 Tax=Streptomyces coelicoflavus TaxID=285562 RepID=UPI003D4E7757
MTASKGGSFDTGDIDSGRSTTFTVPSQPEVRPRGERRPAMSSQPTAPPARRGGAGHYARGGRAL